MKVHSNFAGQTSKHRLLALSCATALASFAFIAKPALAEEATADSTANLDTRATTTANVETTADLVETKVVDAKPATEATANTSEEAASVNTDAGTNLTTVTVSQEQTPDQPAIATNAVEAQATNTESSASTGHYYSDGTIKTPMVKTSKAHKPLMVKTFTLKTMGDKSREISPKTVIIMMVTRVSVLLIVMLDEEQVYGST